MAIAYSEVAAPTRFERATSCACSKLRRTEKGWRFLRHRPTVAGMITILSTVVSILGFRLRRRASLELELIALRHQVSVLRRQRPGRLRLFSTDRLLWVWLYRVWPQVLNAMVLVKPATVIQCGLNEPAGAGVERAWRKEPPV